MNRPHVTVVTPCYNEEENVNELYKRIKAVFDALPGYKYTHLFVDNCSTDNTVDRIRVLASRDKNVRAIVNARNFGHIRSPFYGLLCADTDAAILMASDLQDPPELIPDYLRLWEQGNKVVMAVKTESEESAIFFAIRKIYYTLVRRISSVELLQNFTGTGLYDHSVLKVLRSLQDPYPYFRGLIAELGFKSATVTYRQPLRKRGITKNNFYTLFDMAMLGITNHSRVPLRMATFFGFVLSFLSLLVAVGFFIAKLAYWNSFALGIAPLLIGTFFMFSVLLFFIGILGEYVGAILTQVQRRPLVIEQERIGFESESDEQITAQFRLDRSVSQAGSQLSGQLSGQTTELDKKSVTV